MKISGRQIAAARSLLNWSQDHLAEAAEVNKHTIFRWESGHTEPHQSTVIRIVKAIEDRGVEFLNGGAPGVRFKPKPEAADTESAGK